MEPAFPEIPIDAGEPVSGRAPEAPFAEIFRRETGSVTGVNGAHDGICFFQFGGAEVDLRGAEVVVDAFGIVGGRVEGIVLGEEVVDFRVAF